MTDKAQHTPPPWEASELGDYGDFGETSIVISADIRRIAAVHAYEGDGETLANARLIAAAPELLEAALAMALYHNSGGHEGNLEEALRLTNAAIAKARGEA